MAEFQLAASHRDVTRKWVPEVYLDEVVPAPRLSPDEWIVAAPDGSFRLAAGDPYGEDAEPTQALNDGDVVAFEWTEDHAALDLTFHRSADGEWSWTLSGTEPVASEGSSMIVADDLDRDTMCDSVDELAQDHIDSVRPDDGDKITIAFWAWSDKPTEFTFHADPARFVAKSFHGSH